jgi:hypothetical protein
MLRHPIAGHALGLGDLVGALGSLCSHPLAARNGASFILSPATPGIEPDERDDLWY